MRASVRKYALGTYKVTIFLLAFTHNYKMRTSGTLDVSIKDALACAAVD